LSFSIAIPSSTLIDESNKLIQFRKISQIARACSIFSVSEILIYDDKSENKSKLLISVLKYLETPPYFRKKLYPKTEMFKYAGTLQPLQIYKHLATSDPKKIKIGDIREGLTIRLKKKTFIDIGIKNLIPFYGEKETGKRIVVKIKEGYPNFSVKEISDEELKEYWGYNVKERKNLPALINAWPGKIILTSKKGTMITKIDLKEYLYTKKPVLIVFGSPEKGLHEMLGGNVSIGTDSKILNFFPKQATETVRLEEAIIGTLSILNIFRKN